MKDNFTIAEAAARVLALREASTSFLHFVQLTHPDFKIPDFHLELIEALDALEKGTLGKDKLMINMPVRHGKTWLASVCFPVYYIGRRPARKILASSYSAELANTIGKDVRNLAQERAITDVFPHFAMDERSQAAADWQTTDRGKYYGCGVAGSTSGRPANLLIWDDLLKNREEADSPTQRNKAWSHYVSALVKRLEPESDGTPAKEIGIMTRWHPDDPCGRIIDGEDYKEGDWHHITLPGIRKVQSQIKLAKYDLPTDDARYLSRDDCQKTWPANRFVTEEIDAALWPERFPLPYLLKQKRLDPKEFEALYQQQPFIAGGQIIKNTWWQTYDEKLTDYASVIVAIDTAFQKKETSSFSVAIVLGLTHTGDIHILEVHRERLEYPDLKRKVIILNNLHRGKGLRGIYIEDRASGQSLIQDLRRENGIAVIPVKAIKDKIARANAISPLIEGGRVFLPESAPWLEDFLKETESFPNSKHDDQVDALSMGLDALSRISVGNTDMINLPLEMSGSLNNQFTNVHPLRRKDGTIFKGWGE